MAREFTAPLSFAQEQLWFLDQMDPGRRTYNIPLAMRLRGPIEIDALRTAVTDLVRRHEALRTTINEIDGTPRQVVAPAPIDELALPVHSEAAGPGEDRDAVAQRLVHAAGDEPFDLRTGPLFRPTLHRLGPDDHLLTLYTHHMISDGWSIGVIVSELAELYRAARTRTASRLPELPIQYADYAAWQRDRLSGDAFEAELRHWEDNLAGAQILDLPTDRPRPAVPSFNGGSLDVEIAGDLLPALRALARAHRVTLFMALIAAFDVVMCRYTGQDDVVVGTATAGRDLPELEGVVGFFTNMVVLRVDLSGDPTFAEVLDRVRDVTLAAYAHQELPFEKVVARVAPRRDPSRNPLFQVAIGVLPRENQAGEGSGLRTEILTPSTGGSRFDIAINVAEHDEVLQVFVEYATDLFDDPRMGRMMGHLEQVLAAVAADESLRISQIPLLTEAERQQILHDWQGPTTEIRKVPIHQLIVEQAAAQPDAIAARCAGQQLTYGELERRSGLLARYLRSRGVGREDVVGVALERGLDVPVALIAVLRAGGAFLAADASHPPARVDYMLRDAGTKLVLTSQSVAPRLPAADDRDILALEQVWPAADALADEPLPELADAGNAAYVLYTSGSTGKPKGVVIEHQGLCTFTHWMSGVFEVEPGDRMLQFAPLVFDLAEGEIFTALTRGATLILVPEDVTLSPPKLSELIRDERCTYVGAAPAMLGLLGAQADEYPALRGILVGGEAFSGDLVNRWNLPGRTFVNGYGPTEVTIGCTYYPCDHIRWVSSPPIGRAMPNRTAYLVDRWNNLVPVGVPGELIIGGDGLARGYLGRPELTAERFVDDPFVPGGRVYRTGDLAVWTEKGQIQFLGRIDTQVKLRGQRIELGEIEAVLASHPKVNHAAVAVREDTPGDKRLVGYVTAHADPPTVSELREHLGRELPAYMVPAAFMVLEELPIASTGKVDRPALPALDPPRETGAADTAPRTDAERTVAEVFAAVLNVPRVGVDDDFFALGGSSLQVATVIARLRERTGVTLPMRDVYGTPTVDAVANALEAAGDAERQSAQSHLAPLVPLRSSGSRPPLFCVPHVQGLTVGYVGIVRFLPEDQPVYVMEPVGLDDDREPLDSMAELADIYIATIRSCRPHGPYALVGHSMGGTTGYEMAVRLAAAGEEVKLILIDSFLEKRTDVDRNLVVETFLDVHRQLAENVYEKPAERAPAGIGNVNDLPDDVFLDRLTEVMRANGHADDLDPVSLRRQYGVFSANARAFWDYHPSERFPGEIVLIRAADEGLVDRGFWDDWALGGVSEYDLPGGHVAILSLPYAVALYTTIANLLDKWWSEDAR